MANTKKHSDNTKTIDFRGEKFRIDCAAVKSVKVQRALAGITEDANRGYWAIDKILCGNLDDAFPKRTAPCPTSAQARMPLRRSWSTLPRKPRQKTNRLCARVGRCPRGIGC